MAVPVILGVHSVGFLIRTAVLFGVYSRALSFGKFHLSMESGVPVGYKD